MGKLRSELYIGYESKPERVARVFAFISRYRDFLEAEYWGGGHSPGRNCPTIERVVLLTIRLAKSPTSNDMMNTSIRSSIQARAFGRL